MKTTKYILSILLLMVFAMNAKAQRDNKLMIEDIVVEPGTTAQLPVKVVNTDDVVAVEFDLTLPEGITMEETAVQTDRMDGHQTTIRNMGDNTYKVMLFSPTNKPIHGNNGTLLKLNVNIPSDLEEGSEHPLAMANSVLGIATGENVLTTATAGKIRVSRMPDLTVKNILGDKTSFSPGERIMVSWQVENLGELATEDGWSEQVSLVSEDGTESKLIGTTYYYQTLGAKSVVSRNTEIQLPALLGVEGQMKLQVRIIPFDNTKEPENARENNTKQSDALYYINKVLTLELSPLRFIENEVTKVYARLNRSGRWNEEQTFQVVSTNDSRIAIPTTVTIAAGQSAVVFYMPVTDNEVLDNDSIINISIDGNGYEAVSGQLVIEDNEFPNLSVTASKSVVNEGETFQLTITTSRASAQHIVVTLMSENSKRFSFPSQVTIPAGETSVTVTVEAVDNDDIELQESVAFIATAEKYNRGEGLVLINDDDMPTLTFTLSPNSVGESDGNTALFGVIKRTDNLDKNVTIKLSDDNNGLLSYPSTLTMEKGQTELEFSVGVIDNNVVDGNKTVQMTAAVYASSCNCSVPADSNGSLTQTVTIIDDDGPTLKIKASANSLLEGSTGNVFTISHNVVTDHDITVRITSDKDNLFEYNHDLVIPAGSSSAQLLVDVKSNDQFGDSDLATFKVEGDGFSLGTCWIVITDQTLPDAVVSLTADKSEAEAESAVTLRAEVTNIGYNTLPSTTPLTISFTGRGNQVNLNIGKALAPGESTIVEYNYDLPAITGNYSFKATVNASREVQELVYANNNSEQVAIKLLPRFSVNAQVDKDVYRHGEAITIAGQASGSAGKNANVEVYIINDGIRQTLNGITDSEGNYSITWQPLDRQSGHFIVGACYPGTNETTEMDSFDVYGIQLDGFFTTCQFGLTETYNGTIRITNPGNLPQTGINVEPKATSENCEFTFSPISQIGAGETVTLNFTIKGNGLTEGTNWQQMPIVISTNEGSTASHTIYYYVQSLTGALQANTTQINTTMTLGQVREYPVTITNIGKGETGKITLSLPSWMSSTTAHEMASLNSGDSTTVVLRFVPNDEMKLNVPVEGQLGINCANGNGVAIHFVVTPVSEQTGNLIVDVVDEFTFFTSEAPHVANAKVMIKAPVSGTVVAEGVTGEDGKFTTSIPEGWYKITVEAANHNSYNNTLIVDPGMDNEQEVFLSYQTITYTWEVVETEIEDEYEIETVAKFDTRVPKPVVIVSLPDETPEPYSIVPVTVTNEGLISAVDINMSLTIDNDDYYFEFLNDPILDTLRAKQSYVFYAKMLPVPENTGAKRRMAKESNKKCYTIIAKAKYKELCEKYVGEELAYRIKKWGDRYCVISGKGSNNYGPGYNYGGIGGYGGGGFGPGSPNISGNHNYDSTYIIYDTDDPAKFCSVCEIKKTDSDTSPILNYKLVSGDYGLTDFRNNVIYKGVAADGVSKVKIVLDCKTSSVPSDESGWTYHWSLVDDNGKIGTLENTDSYNDVVYIAPPDFPDKTGSEKKITAQLIYGKDGVKNDTITQEIVLTRPPLVLLHGLMGDPGAWSDFYEVLVNRENLYESWQVDISGYKRDNTKSFKHNTPVAGKKIKKLIDKYNRHGIVAKKADIGGHSMGGVLCRLHVQHVDNTNVHKLITINTPHSGSEVGDIATFIIKDNDFGEKWNSFITQIVKLVSKYKSGAWWDSNSFPQAALDLAVNSDATDDYLNNKIFLSRMNNIPVHTIGSKYNYVNLETLITDLKYNVKSLSELDDDDGFFTKLLSILVSLSNCTGKDLKSIYPIDHSDIIVSTESQYGGLPKSCTWEYPDHTFNAMHMGVTHKKEVINHFIDMLNEPISSNKFCKTGFNPVPLDYNFEDYWNSNNHQRLWAPKLKASQKSSFSQVREATLNSDSSNAIFDFSETFQGADFQCAIVKMGKYVYPTFNHAEVPIPSTFQGEVKAYGLYMTADSLFLVDSLSVYVPVCRTQPINIEYPYNIYTMIDEEHYAGLTCTWMDGSKTQVLPESVVIDKKIASFDGEYIKALKSGDGLVHFTYKGLTCDVPIHVIGDEIEEDNESSSICSTITLSFKQKMVMTRQAFRGTLTVNNGSEIGAMTDVKMNLEVRDTDGKLMTSHEFQINPESLNGFEGELNFNSGWTLDAKGTGVATILFIPTKYAAPSEPKDYSFGGTFSYTDPTTGLYVTRELNPVTLTVKPSPELDLDYFLQRDVFGDDPLTEEVEPMQPAEFALLINNKGYGDATNVRMVTQQPQIIDNEKGLLIDFELLSSQVNGSDKTLAFGQSIANDFGTIDAQSQAYAQWWLQSSLLGHFTEYSVKANHVTSYGNEDLSLLDQVNIHELIHGFTPTSGGRGFLVNDIVDAADMPDGIYFTDATQESVSIATNFTITQQGDDYLLTIMPTQTGWNYGSLIDPTNGGQQIKSITRMSDGVEIPLDNVWRTDRTLRDGKDPIAENRLHFVCNILSDSESYLLSFTPREEVSNVVTGHVAAQAENGQSVVGATVTLCSGDVIYTTTTDGTGNFTLKVDDTSLDYVMTCTAEGFIDGHEKDVRFLGDAVKCDYTLMPGATIKIPASGICTYSSVVGLDFSQASLPIKAYYGKRYDTERVIIDELSIAAANEGLVLMGQPNMNVDVPAATNASPLSDNVLTGTAFAPYTVTTDDVYVLANKTGKAKFHQAARGLTIPKHKAYLILYIGEAGAKGIDIIFDEATLIEMVKDAENDKEHFGINGIRINENMKGLHVVKGKKVIVKY